MTVRVAVAVTCTHIFDAGERGVISDNSRAATARSATGEQPRLFVAT